MTDPTQNNEQLNEEEVANFGWWLCMLPFVVGAGVFTYFWWQHRIDAGSGLNLMYALGILILGVLVTGMVNGAAGENAGTGRGGMADDKKS